MTLQDGSQAEREGPMGIPYPDALHERPPLTRASLGVVAAPGWTARLHS